MTAYSVADAKNRLPSLIDKALGGEEVVITRRGKPVAELRPAATPPAPPTGTDTWLDERTRARPGVGMTSLEILDLLYRVGTRLSAYFDTSVLLPRLIEEPASATIRRYLTTHPQERLISDFAAAEVASAFSRLVRMGLLASADASSRLAEFDAWRAATSVPVDIGASDARLAYVYVRRFDLRLRAPDALHIAIVRRLDATLVTLDRRMAHAAEELGISVDVPKTS